MYYIWDDNSNDDVNGFFSCGLAKGSGDWLDVVWFMGNKIDLSGLTTPIKYFSDSMLMPEDYPFTISSEFLVSKKIAGILREMNVPNLDYYESIIIRNKNNDKIDGFYSINILNVLDCIDFKKSKYKAEDYGTATRYDFNKLVLDESKIPSDIKVFRLKYRKTLVVAHKSIVEACERENVTGINFIPVEEYQDI